jgi:WD40 repeat protein
MSEGAAARARALPANPFLLLDSYDESKTLYGRDGDLTLIQARMAAARTTLLFAGSGVGKTSFLQAKLIPELRLRQDVFFWKKWSEPRSPAEVLAGAISKGRTHSLREALGTYRGARTRAKDWAEWGRSGDGEARDCVLILDQFEEIFQYHADYGYFTQFLDEFCAAVRDGEIRLRVLLSMREEFLGELSVFDNRLPDLFGNYYRLKQLDRRQAADIIRSTCAESGTEVDEEKLQVLVEDLGTMEREPRKGEEPELVRRDLVPPPYLQIAGYRLWEKQKATEQPAAESGEPAGRGRFLAPYHAGTAVDCLKEFCREKLDKLSYVEQMRAAAAFEYLVTTKGAKAAHELSRLARYTGTSEAKLKKALKPLTEPRTRILRNLEGPDGTDWYELYHDVFGPVMSEWSREFRARQRRAVTRGAAAAALLVLALSWLTAMRRDPAQYLATLRDENAPYALMAHAYEALKGTSKAAEAGVLMRGYWERRAADEELHENREAALLARLNEWEFGQDDSPLRAAGLLAGVDLPNLLTMVRVPDLGPAMLSADGQAVLTATNGGKMRAWDARTGKPLTQTVAGGGPAPGPATAKGEPPEIFDPARWMGGTARSGYWGARVAGRLPQASLEVFSLRTGALIGRIPPRVAMAYPDLSPDGRYAVVQSSPAPSLVPGIERLQGTPYALDSVSGERIEIPVPNARSLAFRVDDSLWALADGTTIRFWNPVERKLGTVQIRAADAGNGWRQVRFSGDGTRICGVGERGSAGMWEVATGKQIGGMVNDRAINACSVASDGSLLTANDDGFLRWDAGNGQGTWYPFPLWPLTRMAALAPDGNTFFDSVGEAVRIWRAAVPELRGRYFDGNVSRLSDDGRVAIATGEAGLNVVDLASGKTWPLPNSSGARVVELTGGLAAASVLTKGGRNFSVWDTRSGETRLLMTFADQGLADWKFSPDGNVLVLASRGVVSAYPTAELESKSNEKPYTIGRYKGSGADLIFSPDGRYVAAVTDRDEGGTLASVFETGKAGQTAKQWQVNGMVTLGNHALFATVDQALEFIDLTNGAKTVVQPGPAPEVTAAEFGPGDGQVVFGLADGSLQFWDGTKLQSLGMGSPARDILVAGQKGELIAVTRGGWAHRMEARTGSLRHLGSRFLGAYALRFIGGNEWPTLRVLAQSRESGFEAREVRFDLQGAKEIEQTQYEMWATRFALKMNPDSGKFAPLYDEGPVIRSDSGPGDSSGKKGVAQ